MQTRGFVTGGGAPAARTNITDESFGGLQAFGTQGSGNIIRVKSSIIGSRGLNRSSGAWWEEQRRLQVKPILGGYVTSWG